MDINYHYCAVKSLAHYAGFSPTDKPRLFYSATILLAVCTLFWHMPASAALNDSGQITCSDGSTLLETNCVESIIGDNGEYPRQDARFGRDAQATDNKLGKNGGGHGGFDFTKICNDGVSDCTGETMPGTDVDDWGCTRDNVTGLLWEIKMSDYTSPRYSGHTFTWYDGYSGSPGDTNTCRKTLGDSVNCNTKEYVEYINGMELCGANNWRLPTRRELLSIVNNNQSYPNPLIDTDYFPNTVIWHYWASESFSDSTTTFGWRIHFMDASSWIGQGSSAERIRLVSGTMPASSLQDNGDRTVSDGATGLMWDQCAIGQHWQHSTSGGYCTDTATEFTWKEALEKVVELNDENHRGYNDWRLPNIKELESLTVLVPDKRYAIDEGFFPQTPYSRFWSASVSTLPLAWGPIKVVNFSIGEITPSDYSDDAYVRLVRGGQAFDRLTVNKVTLSAVADSPTSAVLTITVDRDATGYWLVRPAGNQKPNVNDLAAGSSGSLTANAATFNLTGLVASTAYDVWFTAKVDSNYSLIQHTTFVTQATPPTPQVKAFNDGDTLHYGILYFAPAGAPGFCLGDDLIDVSVQVTIDSVTYRITPRLNNTCLQVFPTGIGSQRALIIERGTADITTSASGTPLLLTRSGDLVTADNPGAIIRATVDPLCTSTRITPLLGLISAPAWIVTPPPQTGCPADAITPPQAGYILNDGTLACDPAALTLKGTYAQFTIRWTQMLDAGQNFYVAAAVPGIAWFEDSVQNGEGPYWRVLQNFDPYAVVTTEGPLSASLFEGVDMRYLTGSEIYVGYGQDLVDMFSNRRYCTIIKVAPPAH